MAIYQNLVNKSGTIYNTSGPTPNTNSLGGYATPEALAADLGIDKSAISWNQIQANPNYTPQVISTTSNPSTNYSINKILGSPQSNATITVGTAPKSPAITSVTPAQPNQTIQATGAPNTNYSIGSVRTANPNIPSMNLASVPQNAAWSPPTATNYTQTASQIPPPPVQTAPAQDFQVTPQSNVGSTALANTTWQDIQSRINKNLDSLDQLFSNMSAAATIPQTELDLQKQATEAQAKVTGLQAQEAGIYNPDNKPIATEFLQGQARSQLFSAQLQQQITQAQLAYAQGNRQFAFNAAKDIYNAGRQSLLDSIQIYTATSPQNVSSTYNPYTGDITSTFRSPLTGQQWSSIVGNAGVQKNYTDFSLQSTPTGQIIGVGVKPNGTQDIIPITGMGGILGTSSAQNNSNLQQAVGQVAVPGYGGAVNPQTNQPYRTDSNNNPIAAAVTTNGNNQFTAALNQAGIQWTYGNPFPNNPNMSTIKILGNGVEGARTILANSNALQGWYATSTGATVMQQYGIKSNTDFAKANTQTQNAIIDGIYKAEGGSGILTHPEYLNQKPMLSIQQQVQNIPSYLQQYISTSPSGYVYFNTANMPTQLVQQVPYFSSGTQIQAPSPENATREQNIKNAYYMLNVADNLISNLPTQVYDPARLVNIFNATLQNDPTMAQINQAWQGAISAMLASGISSGRMSTVLINKASTTDFPNPGSIQDVAKAQIQFVKNQLQGVEQDVFGTPPPVDYAGAAKAYLGQSSQTTDTTYNNLIQLWSNINSPQVANK